MKKQLSSNAWYRGTCERETLQAFVFQGWLSARRRVAKMQSAKSLLTEVAIYIGKLCQCIFYRYGSSTRVNLQLSKIKLKHKTFKKHCPCFGLLLNCYLSF